MFGLALIIGTNIPAVTRVMATKVGVAVIVALVALLLVLAFTV
jgi:hypothetical protein